MDKDSSLNNGGGRKDVRFDWLETYLFLSSKTKDMILKPWSDSGRKLISLILKSPFLINPPFCTMGTGSFPGVKRLGRGADHPPPSIAEVENG
jgi:hypothetical protein